MPPKKRVRSGESEQGIEEESDRARSPTPSSDGGAEDRKGGEKARRKKINYSEEEEIELADWLKTHPHIYTKGLRDYKDTDKKTRLWEEKAKDMNVNVDMLQTWYKSIRTRIGKLTVEKSGTARKEISVRDRFLLDTFSFLKDQIARKPTRQGVTVSMSMLQ